MSSGPRAADLTLLIGHRGTGKTSLLERLARYRPDARVLDLDTELTRREGRDPFEIFASEGEAHFRKLEAKTLQALLDERVPGVPLYIALGAGFASELPKDAEVLWVRRPTDRDGRIFIDRPRLIPTLGHLEEFEARRTEREARYARQATRTLLLREGLGSKPDATEAMFFSDAFRQLGGILTLRPEHARRGWRAFFAPRLNWGLDAFEIRNDLLSANDLHEILKIVPPAQLLLSSRPGASWKIPVTPGARHDWEIALGDPDFAPEILSTHQRAAGENLAPAFTRLEAAAQKLAVRFRQARPLLKAALPAQDFTELAAGHDWQSGAPTNRAFLPMSADGRWNWYRLRFKGLMPLNFWREDEGSAPDQPTLLEWAAAPAQAPAFAAVLGDPVHHSMSPVEHQAYFAKRGWPFVAVRVTESDWDSGALATLQGFGLQAAAVTAPLKLRAFAASGQKSESARELESVNTLAWNGHEWLGDNSDLEGFRFVVRNVSLRAEIAVWGGGGTLALLKRVVPHASFYSARTGERRSGPGAGKPRFVIWAAGPKSDAMPPDVWEPRAVFDLDYRENSLGRAYALKTRARYINGRPMFERQAKLQRVFWTRVLG